MYNYIFNIHTCIVSSLFILVERWQPRPQVKIVLGRSPLLMISCMEAMWPQPMYTSEWVSEAVNTDIYITPRCKSRGGKSGVS